MRACSKINLVLNVRGERPDGFHEIDTLFYPLPRPADDVILSFESGGGTESLRIACSDPGVPSDPEKNLCGKAVHAYCRAAGMDVPPCTVTIRKEIPCAGGMGGGSSDAAAVLLMMQERFRRLSGEALRRCAFALGADVPFFLHPVPSRGTGAGECLTPLPELPAFLPIAVATPDFPISAKWAYEHWIPAEALPSDAVPCCVEALKSGDLRGAARFMGNSLAPAAFRKFPLLGLLKDAFLSEGALCAVLSGSGPAIFALFPDPDTARKACEILRETCAPVRFFC